MANIVFLSLVFPPDGVSTAQIMGHLAQDFQALGHEVVILTTTPHYNQDVDAELKQPLQYEWGKLLQKSHYHGIPVYHVWMPRKGTNIAARLLAWVGFHIVSTIVGMIKLKSPDIFIVPSPPLTSGLSAWILGVIKRAPFIYNVQEIYPDYAISLGAIQNRWLIWALYKLESFVYAKAASVTVIAAHMADLLTQKRVPRNKIEIIPNFVDIDDLFPLPKDNDFSKAHRLTDKFVVSYAGNMGPAQDLDTFVDAAVLLQARSDIHFLMVGNGIQQSKMKQRLESLNLPNFTILPYQPYSLMLQIYAASDLCLVPQSANISDVAVPSKVYRIMACARPVLASTPAGSDLANLVGEGNCGIISDAGSADSMANAIHTIFIARQRVETLGENGRQHVTQHYSRTSISKKYAELINKVLSA